MTVEVMKSFCRSSDDLQALEEREESEQSPVRSVSGSLRRWQVSETPSPPLSPVPADDMVRGRFVLCCCYCFVYSHLLM